LFDCLGIVIIVLLLKLKMLETKGAEGLGTCQTLPRESDTGVVGNKLCRMLPRDSNCDRVCLLEAETWNRRICICPESGLAQFAAFWRRQMPRAVL